MTKPNLSVSSKSKRSDFPRGKWQNWPFEEKVRLFQEQIQGWVINVVRDIIQKQIPHADFAILSILLSYFENIAKFTDGYNRYDDSGLYFGKGIKYVYPRKLQKKTIKLLYEQARNGMYHMGLTGPKVELNCLISSGFVYKRNRFVICPKKLFEEIQKHFNKYCENLKNPQNSKLRQNFEIREKSVLGI